MTLRLRSLGGSGEGTHGLKEVWRVLVHGSYPLTDVQMAQSLVLETSDMPELVTGGSESQLSTSPRGLRAGC